MKTGSKCKLCTARQLDSSQSEGKDVGTSNKRFHPSSTPDYYSTSPQFYSFSTPNMSLSPQQQQFSGSYIPSPPGQYTPQYMTIGSAQPQPPSTQIPPQWANSIMDDSTSYCPGKSHKQFLGSYWAAKRYNFVTEALYEP